MANGLAIIYLFPDRCIHPCPGEHSRMPWPMDLHLYIYFHPAASTHVLVSIPECHCRPTSIYLFISGQVHSSMSRGAFPNAMADGPAFFYFFPDRCIHPCPGEHSRMPWPMHLHLYIYFHPAVSTHVPVSIPECHGQPTCIYLFISGQVHASNPGQAFPSAKADGPVFIYISPASCMHTSSDHHSTVLEPLYRYIFPVI